METNKLPFVTARIKIDLLPDKVSYEPIIFLPTTSENNIEPRFRSDTSFLDETLRGSWGYNISSGEYRWRFSTKKFDTPEKAIEFGKKLLIEKFGSKLPKNSTPLVSLVNL